MGSRGENQAFGQSSIGINEYNGKISVDLSPKRFDLDEFNDKELSSFGVKRTGRKYSWE